MMPLSLRNSQSGPLSGPGDDLWATATDVSQPKQKRREVTWDGRETGVEIPVVKQVVLYWDKAVRYAYSTTTHFYSFVVNFVVIPTNINGIGILIHCMLYHWNCPCPTTLLLSENDKV